MKQLFRSPLFLLGLFLLVLNDFVLKEAFGNLLTGKLSDFAGMFIFPLFWLALFPKRKKLIFILSGLFFIWWKSPLSQGVIEAWNGLGIFQMGRVVDYSDLLSLLMLPLAWWYAAFVEKGKAVVFVKLNPAIPLALACFAFVATSYEQKFNVEPPQITTFNYSLDSLKTRLYRFPDIQYYDPEGSELLDLDSTRLWRERFVSDTVGYERVPVEDIIRDSMTFFVRSDFCQDAYVVIGGDSLSAWLRLYCLYSHCEGRTTLNQQLGDFNEVVIEGLK